MYIKLVLKNGIVYYILYVYDKQNDYWASRFISEEIYNALKDILNVHNN